MAVPMEIATGERPLPRRWQASPSRVLPASTLRPGLPVFLRLPYGWGFTQIRGARLVGDQYEVSTDYGLASARADQTLRVYGA